MKFKLPDPTIEDEIAREHLKKMKEDGVMDFWPTLLYDESDNKVPEEPDIRHIKSDGKVTDKNNLTLRK